MKRKRNFLAEGSQWYRMELALSGGNISRGYRTNDLEAGGDLVLRRWD
jgi:hypothetical protein